MWESEQVIQVLVETSVYSNLDIWLWNQPVCLRLSFREQKETFFVRRDVMNLQIKSLVWTAFCFFLHKDALQSLKRMGLGHLWMCIPSSLSFLKGGGEVGQCGQQILLEEKSNSLFICLN